MNTTAITRTGDLPPFPTPLHPVGVGRWVEYHGSIRDLNGRSFRVEEVGEDGRYTLVNPYYGTLLDVRRTSFRPIE